MDHKIQVISNPEAEIISIHNGKLIDNVWYGTNNCPTRVDIKLPDGYIPREVTIQTTDKEKEQVPLPFRPYTHSDCNEDGLFEIRFMMPDCDITIHINYEEEIKDEP